MIVSTDTPISMIIRRSRHADNTDERSELIERLRSTVDFVCRKWLINPVISRLYEIDDMRQECFIVIFRKVMNRFAVDPDKADPDIMRIFVRYVINSLNNHWRDALKAANCRLHLAQESTVFPEESGIDGMFGHLENRHDAEEAELLGNLRRRVGEEDFRIAYLRYQGNSYEQIARMLGLCGGTIRARVTRRIAPTLRNLVGSVV